MVATDTALSRPPQIEGANFLNLLIVDDDRAVREACRAVAQSLGFSPHVAESAEQAYRLLDSRGADVILLDLKLPGRSWIGRPADHQETSPRGARNRGHRLWNHTIGGPGDARWGV
jgi:response regulator RpfG family c-di-GMP phosphodiesterase